MGRRLGDKMHIRDLANVVTGNHLDDFTRLDFLSSEKESTKLRRLLFWGCEFNISTSPTQSSLSIHEQFNRVQISSDWNYVCRLLARLVPGFSCLTLAAEPPYLWGQIIMFIGFVIIGGLGIPHLSTSTGWAIGALMLMLTSVYDFTIGPVCYSLVAELPSTRLRIKTVVLARTMHNFTGILIGILQPRFMNPTAWNWGGKAAFF